MTILPLILALPLVGALIVSLLPSEDHDDVRGASMVASVVTFIVSLVLWTRFDMNEPGFQFAWSMDWIPVIHSRFALAIDGLSLLLIVLTTFLLPLTILGSWRAVSSRVKEFHVCLLLLEASMLAVLCVRDVLVFYVFWEAMLVPMFLLIGIWGSEDRLKATIKFFLYTAAGSLVMLAGIVYVYNTAGSFDMEAMATAASGMSTREQTWLALAFGLAFAIKVPLFPFHTWLPHAHVQAPAAGSVQLAAVMLKMGGYGFLRLAMPFFPEGIRELAVPVSCMAATGVVYGSLMALAQNDLKRLIAYSSVAHLAMVVLGLFSLNEIGLAGAVYQMLAHGLSTGALFLMVGMLYERRHTRDISQYGGLAASAPWLTAAFIGATMASIAVPGTAGFVGEFLILIGAFKASPWHATIGAFGVVLGAAYMLWLVRRVFFGPLELAENRELEDLNLREAVVLIPLLAMMLVMGVLPGPFLKLLEGSLEPLVKLYAAGG